MNKFSKPFAWVLALGLLASMTLAGCSNTEKTNFSEQDMEKSRLSGEKKREIFNRANGEYDQMSPEDKKAFTSMFKNEEDARKAWSVMKNPPTGPTGLQ